MNWKNEAANDLSAYNSRRESLQNIKEQMEALKAQYCSIRSANPDQLAVHGGASHQENRQLNNIVKRERLKLAYFAASKLCTLTERGLAGLEEQERHVLDRFYINRTHDCVERLMDELGYEKTRVYELKDQALYRFTITMYGISDL